MIQELRICQFALRKSVTEFMGVPQLAPDLLLFRADASIVRRNILILGSSYSNTEPHGFITASSIVVS